MLFSSGPGEDWGTGGCTAVHTQEVARRQRFANRHFRCSSCVVSFLGLQTCDLSTYAIIGTDTLGSILPHTLDIKNGLPFMEGGISLQLHRRDAALSGRVFTVGHCSIPPYSEAVLHCSTHTVVAGLCHPVAFWRV